MLGFNPNSVFCSLLIRLSDTTIQKKISEKCKLGQYVAISPYFEKNADSYTSEDEDGREGDGICC